MVVCVATGVIPPKNQPDKSLSPGRLGCSHNGGRLLVTFPLVPVLLLGFSLKLYQCAGSPCASINATWNAPRCHGPLSCVGPELPNSWTTDFRTIPPLNTADTRQEYSMSFRKSRCTLQHFSQSRKDLSSSRPAWRISLAETLSCGFQRRSLQIVSTRGSYLEESHSCGSQASAAFFRHLLSSTHGQKEWPEWERREAVNALEERLAEVLRVDEGRSDGDPRSVLLTLAAGGHPSQRACASSLN